MRECGRANDAQNAPGVSSGWDAEGWGFRVLLGDHQEMARPPTIAGKAVFAT